MNRTLPPRRGAAGRRGMTLIEIMVVTGVLVVVLGLALGVGMESEKAGRKLIRRQNAILYCQTAMERIVSLVQGAIDPESLEGLTNRTVLNPILKSDELGLITILSVKESALTQMTIQNKKSSPAGTQSIKSVHSPVAETTRGTVTPHEVDLGGVAPEEFIPSVTFAYAAAAPPDKEKGPAYLPTWDKPGLPDLIRITVRAEFANGESPIELETALIPGIVSAHGAAAGAPPQPAGGFTATTATQVTTQAAQPAPGGTAQ